jgi:GNAT superfamily N-acetyltransferase
MPRIRPAATDDDIRRCWPVLRQLRPHLTEAALTAAVCRMAPHGYRLAYAEDADGAVRAVAGYRITEMLRTGPMLEVDDLVTDEAARSGGYGKALLRWLGEEARAAGCSVLELDSAVQRHGAHRFYFREGMHILGYHFSVACSVPDEAARDAGAAAAAGRPGA